MQEVDPPINVEQRLRSLGLWPSGLNPTCPIEHNSLWDWQVCPGCGDVHEPGLVVPTNHGPKGPATGIGRGSFTPQDGERAVFYVFFVKRREL